MELFQKEKCEHQSFISRCITQVTIGKKKKRPLFLSRFTSRNFFSSQFCITSKYCTGDLHVERSTALDCPTILCLGILLHSSPLLPRASTPHSCSFTINISMTTPWFLKNTRYPSDINHKSLYYRANSLIQ